MDTTQALRDAVLFLGRMIDRVRSWATDTASALRSSSSLQSLGSRRTPDRAIHSEDTVGISEHVIAVMRRDADIVGYRAGGSTGPTKGGEATDKGGVAFEYQGMTSKNEEGTLDACRMLVAALRQRGGSWSDPRDPTGGDPKQERGLDCMTTHDGQDKGIQVVRVPTEQAYRKEITRAGKSQRALEAGEAAEVIRDAITHKEGAAAPTTILLLNASDAVSLAMPAAVRAFRDRYGDWSRTVGFDSIWIVGPSVHMCEQLDA